jgi:hypothetical protein
MMRYSDEANKSAFDNPKAGDYWSEHFCPVLVVLEACSDGTYIICDKKKTVDIHHWTWDLDQTRQVNKSHFNRLKYGSIEGFWADVDPEGHMWAVDEWTKEGKHCAEYLFDISKPVASDFRTVMEQGI